MAKESKQFTVETIGNTMCIIDLIGGHKVAMMQVSPNGSFMQNAELVSEVVNSYEKYINGIRKSR